MTRLCALLVFLPALALADSGRDTYRDAIDDASDSLDDAVVAARRVGGSCNAAVGELTRSLDGVDSVRRGTTDRRLAELSNSVNDVLRLATNSGCGNRVAGRISRAAVALTTARDAMGAADNRGRHHRHRHDDDDDDDDDRDDRRVGPQVPPPSNPPPNGRVEATLGELRVVTGERVDNEPGVRVELTSVTLRNLGRTQFYFGGRIRAEGGEWSPWVTSAMTSAPSDPYSWNNAYSQWFPARVLRASDRGGGHFVVRVSLFDANRSELAFREVPLELAGGPATNPPPPPVAANRDCGTGRDPGCTMQRNNAWAMDRDTFVGFYDSLKRTTSDLTRLDMVRSVLAANWITAAQLGMILELFNSDLLRLDAAKACAPHTVNPQHAPGLTSKFRSSLLQADFTRVMTGQR